MIRLGVQLLLVLGLSAHSALAAYQLVWADEFNGALVNETNWEYEIGTGQNGWGNNELEYYTADRHDNARIEAGHLVIDVKVEEYQGKSFTSARMKSLHAWAFGKFEARARMPSGHHLWPAIWLFPKYQRYGIWAASGEIDILEVKGDKPDTIQGSIHAGGSWPNNVYHGSGEKAFPGTDFSKDFHTFTLEWDHKELRWLLDEKVYHTESIDKSMWGGKGTNPYTKNGQPFDETNPFFFILNIAVGGQFFGGGPYVTPAEARGWAKHTMEIDYLRVYQDK